MKIITYNCSGPFDIDKFGDFDIFFIQRCVESMLPDISYQYSYVENYKEIGDPQNRGRGLCIVSKNIILDNNVSTGIFSWWAPIAHSSQGKRWQILTIYIDNKSYKFINGLPSYSTGSENGEEVTKIYEKNRAFQTKELLDLIDTNTVLVGDFHQPDHCLEEELNLDKRNLINYIKDGTFTCKDGSIGSIDKIITTKDSPFQISNVFVVKYNKDNLMGHWPIRFDLKVVN